MAHPDSLVETTAGSSREARLSLHTSEFRGSKHFLTIGQVGASPTTSRSPTRIRTAWRHRRPGQPDATSRGTARWCPTAGGWVIEAWRYNMKPATAATQPTILNKPGFRRSLFAGSGFAGSRGRGFGTNRFAGTWHPAGADLPRRWGHRRAGGKPRQQKMPIESLGSAHAQIRRGLQTLPIFGRRGQCQTGRKSARLAPRRRNRLQCAAGQVVERPQAIRIRCTRQSPAAGGRTSGSAGHAGEDAQRIVAKHRPHR